MYASGVEVRPLRQMTGGADFNDVFLSEVAVPDTYRLVEVDSGWKGAVATLLHERGAIGGAAGGGSGLLRLVRHIAMGRRHDCSQDRQVRQASARLHAHSLADFDPRPRAAAAPVTRPTTPAC